MFRLMILAAAVVAIGAASTHAAAPLQAPAGSYVESVCKDFVCQIDNNYYNDPSSYGRHSLAAAAGGGATEFNPAPALSLSAIGTSYDTAAAVHAEADITYSFRYTAKDLDAAAALDAYRQSLLDGGVLCGARACRRLDQTPVLTISGYYSLAATAGETVLSHVVAGGDYQTFQRACSGVGSLATTCGAGAWSILGSLTKVSALDYDGWLHLDAEADLPENAILCGSACLGQAAAWIDPLISFRSDFAGAGDFTLQLSPGVQNGSAPPQTSAAPEPAAWALVILGFAMTGVAARRRRERRLAGAETYQGC
ncbi:MAG TPA: PEPxxWA-CTERM sorting domain-containing protein [Phenylobacterium sp.]|nr:PEPxxWA-CTERM sorting domain-containing protein [Phenylobacterium sp.]